MQYDQAVMLSERASAARNRALAYMMLDSETFPEVSFWKVCCMFLNSLQSITEE